MTGLHGTAHLPVAQSLMASLPVGDWQFWLVTLLAIGAAIAIVRPLLPSRGRKATCPGCSADAPKRTTPLTIDGERLR
ncbi:MAG: hypothetical protein KF724_05005 [Phycisphaeraceae bacterium]|nr:hypothetical protein [Phycisphaeraceae bacterium]